MNGSSLLEGRAFILDRLQGGREILLHRQEHIDIPLSDVISKTHDYCREALDEASVELAGENHAEIAKNAQTLTGKVIALQQLSRYPFTLQILLKQYERAIKMCERMPEEVVPKDVALVYDPAEHSQVSRGYEIVASDEVEKRLLKAAMQSGRRDAKFTLGFKLNDRKLLRKAANEGIIDAQYEYACRFSGAKKFQRLYGLTAQSHAEAHNEIGNMYETGEGIAQDYTKAVEHYEKAAAQGHADAQNNLGMMYDEGHGVTQNYAKAVECYEKSAAQGYAEAQNNLGMMYDEGQGVIQNYAKAIEYYEKAAAQGHAEAQTNLGIAYALGCGVLQNYTKAAEYYEKAAAQGYADAQVNLGLLYESGDGVTQDDTQAVRYFIKAAAQGSARGQTALGLMSHEGRGVVQSDAEAVKYFTKAAAQGYTLAQTYLDELNAGGFGIAKNE